MVGIVTVLLAAQSPAKRATKVSLVSAVSGLVIGCGVGIMLSRFLHIRLLTQYFGTPWSLPTKLLIFEN